VATGLQATWQSTAWLGAEAGLLKMSTTGQVTPWATVQPCLY
jgi:hypothetical protein